VPFAPPVPSTGIGKKPKDNMLGLSCWDGNLVNQVDVVEELIELVTCGR
jgi:hypothetical protein